MVETILRLEDYQNLALPTDYDITGVLGDLIMAEFVDCDNDGQLVERDGILLNVDIQRNVWRVARVVMCGAGANLVKPGDYIMFPNDKGIKAIKFQKKGRPITFLNEQRIFCVCKPKKKTAKTSIAKDNK